LDDHKSLKQKVYEELREEVGISKKHIHSIQLARILNQEAKRYNKTWIVHPVLVKVDTDKVKPDWEAQNYIWIRPQAVGLWWDAMDRGQWPTDLEEIDFVKKNWADPYGDRRQEIVLIGQNMNQESLIRMFDSCLLSDKEMELGEEEWENFNDPFPNWAINGEQEEGEDEEFFDDEDDEFEEEEIETLIR
jgi:G3E family GTPase